MKVYQKTLHLNLKKKWFEMIKSGKKKEEYREIKPYWCARFVLVDGGKKTLSWWRKVKDSLYLWNDFIEFITKGIEQGVMCFCPYSSITFSNGMTPPVPRFTTNTCNISIKQGNHNWGAEKGKKYFVLKVGERLN